MNHPAFPVPLVFARLRTELDVPPIWRDRLLDVDVAFGLALQPTPRIEVRAGGGWRWTQVGDLTGNTALIAVTAHAQRVSLLPKIGLDGSLEFDLRWLDPSGVNRVETWLRTGLWWQLRGRLSAFGAGELLRVRHAGVEAWQADWRLGLSWAWLSEWQAN